MTPTITRRQERFETPSLVAGDSVVLRPAELNDAESFLNLAADNIDRLSQALGIWDPPPTVEERRKLMAGDLESVKNGDRHWWMIESEGRLAGAIDIHAIQHRARWGLVGYWLSDRFTGRGIMTRSLQAVIDWAFAERDFVRIEIQSSIDNRASCAVPERLGIRRESIRRQSQQILGRSYDMASYVAFADNWPPKPPDRPLPARTLTVDDEILLRQGKVGDRDSMWNALDTGRNYLGKYLPWMSEYKTEDDHKKGFNRRQYERDLFDGSGGYIVEYRDELAGSIGFGAPNRDNGTEVGYWLREDLQGRGIMTRSVEAVITMLIVEMGLHRVTIRAATSNLPSRGIPERLGFTHEGILRQAGLVNGEYFDLEIYSILDHEWLARSTSA